MVNDVDDEVAKMHILSSTLSDGRLGSQLARGSRAVDIRLFGLGPVNSMSAERVGHSG